MAQREHASELLDKVAKAAFKREGNRLMRLADVLGRLQHDVGDNATLESAGAELHRMGHILMQASKGEEI